MAKKRDRRAVEPTSTLREFGERDPGAQYVLRPGGYVVLLRDEPTREVGVVVTPLGVWLAGGGLDPGESPEDAAIRECLEEIGVEVRLLRRIGMADQLTYAAAESTHFRKRSTYFVGEIVTTQGDGETDHELDWMTVDEAAARLKDAAQRWAVREAFDLE